MIFLLEHDSSTDRFRLRHRSGMVVCVDELGEWLDLRTVTTVLCRSRGFELRGPGRLDHSPSRLRRQTTY
jgi:hypothetical protein